MSCARFWRKSFIHRIALLAPLATLPAADAATKKPNPLFILIDHEGISDVGCYGSDLAESGSGRTSSGSTAGSESPPYPMPQASYPVSGLPWSDSSE